MDGEGVYRGGRIHGGCSLHATFTPEKCPRETPHLFEVRCGPWRCVDCCGVTEDHDIEECARCGRQKTVACTFDEDYS